MIANNEIAVDEGMFATMKYLSYFMCILVERNGGVMEIEKLNNYNNQGKILDFEFSKDGDSVTLFIPTKGVN